jgi:hypothetical protein
MATVGAPLRGDPLERRHSPLEWAYVDPRVGGGISNRRR